MVGSSTGPSAELVLSFDGAAVGAVIVPGLPGGSVSCVCPAAQVLSDTGTGALTWAGSVTIQITDVPLPGAPGDVAVSGTGSSSGDLGVERCGWRTGLRDQVRSVVKSIRGEAPAEVCCRRS